MHERESNSSTAALIVVVLLLGLGLLLVLAVVAVGAFFFLSVRRVASSDQVYYEAASAAKMAVPPDAFPPVPHTFDNLNVGENGELVWNNEPITLDELRDRLQQRGSAPLESQPRVMILPHPQAPPEAIEQIHALLNSLNLVAETLEATPPTATVADPPVETPIAAPTPPSSDLTKPEP